MEKRRAPGRRQTRVGRGRTTRRGDAPRTAPHEVRRRRSGAKSAPMPTGAPHASDRDQIMRGRSGPVGAGRLARPILQPSAGPVTGSVRRKYPAGPRSGAAFGGNHCRDDPSCRIADPSPDRSRYGREPSEREETIRAKRPAERVEGVRARGTRAFSGAGRGAHAAQGRAAMRGPAPSARIRSG